MSVGENMTFFERVSNTISLGIGKYFFPYLFGATERVFDEKFGSDFPGLIDIASKTSLWFYNSEPLIEFPRPILHKTIDIGGISVSDGHKKLNKVSDRHY